MGLFDTLKLMATSAIKREASRAANYGVKNIEKSIRKGKNRTESFIFPAFPGNTEELKALPEASLDSAFKTAALTVAVLCNYENSENATFEMLDLLKGPELLSNYEKQFIRERLKGKYYKSFSYFEGATPENAYTPSVPYRITVMENPYSFDNENWATLFVKSSGADEPRQIKLRRKPSTGQWFLNDIQCLSDIRLPNEEDPWA